MKGAQSATGGRNRAPRLIHRSTARRKDKRGYSNTNTCRSSAPAGCQQRRRPAKGGNRAPKVDTQVNSSPERQARLLEHKYKSLLRHLPLERAGWLPAKKAPGKRRHPGASMDGSTCSRPMRERARSSCACSAGEAKKNARFTRAADRARVTLYRSTDKRSGTGAFIHRSGRDASGGQVRLCSRAIRKHSATL
jgi:hypothetical protein